MKASRFAFAAVLVAASLVPAAAREFHNDRLDGGERSMPRVHASPEERVEGMNAHLRSLPNAEITADVTVNSKGRVTKVELKGTTGNEDLDYTIRRRLRQNRYDVTAEEAARPLVVVVKYRTT